MKKLINRTEVWDLSLKVSLMSKGIGGIAQNEVNLSRDDLAFELAAIRKIEDAILEYRAAIRCGLVDCGGESKC